MQKILLSTTFREAKKGTKLLLSKEFLVSLNCYSNKIDLYVNQFGEREFLVF